MLVPLRQFKISRVLRLSQISFNGTRALQASTISLLRNVGQAQETQSESSSNFGLLSLAGGLALLVVGTAGQKYLNADSADSADNTEQKSKTVAEAYQNFKERTTGHYENRIRAFSHPLKVFQYFSSVHKNGEHFMHPMDFVMSILPYHPGSSEESLSIKDKKKRFRVKCESALEFFKLADTNGDGLISFEEYMFFLTLLATPEADFQIAFKMFDLDESGVIELNEFQRIIQHFGQVGVAGRQGKRERNQVSKELRHGLIEQFFGKNGTGQLNFETFNTFLIRLQDEVLKLEFFSYDIDENDTISMKDFARSMVTYADHRRAEEFAQRIESLPAYSRRISFEEFHEFNQIISKIDKIQFAITMYSGSSNEEDGFTKEDLKRAIKAAVGVALADDTTEVLFRIFDKDGDGNLDPSEFTNVLKGRHLRGLDSPRDIGASAFFEKILTCGRIFLK